MKQAKLFALFGTGRSGSTWLGSVLNTHPDVAYRFEPFHRLRKNTTMQQFRRLVEDPHISEDDLTRLADFLRRADPLTDKPPFFPKDRAFTLGKATLWPAARGIRPLAPVFSGLYSPAPDVPVVFKEVTMERVMRNLVQHTSLKVVYLVRHPCAVVRSVVDGQEQGVMTQGRRTVLGQLLKDHHPELAEQWSDRADALPALEQEALLWRFDVETGIRALEGNPRGKVVYYEDLCENGLREIPGIFSHFDLDYPTETRSFLEDLYGIEEGASVDVRGEKLRNKYFSVFRNPAKAAHKWREKMDAGTRKRVLDIVSDSQVYQTATSAGIWPE